MEVAKINKTISIIIPVYNAERFIDRCLDSVINQTYQNLQIICVNDGSKDNSLEILHSYAKKDPRIVVIDLCENKGVSFARNKGIESACGEYLMFIDADDFIDKHCVETLYNLLQDMNEICVGKLKYLLKADDFSELSSSEDAEVFKYKYDDAIEMHTIKSGVCNKLYPKSLIGEIRFDEQLKYGEDTLFNIDILTKRKASVIMVNKTIYYYDRSHDSATSAIPISEMHKYVQALIDKANVDNLIVSDAVKAMLSLRYVAYVENDKNKFLETHQNLKHFIEKILKLKYMSVYKKIVMIIFIKFPSIYRYYRILTDKSLLEYEKKKVEPNVQK